MQTAIIGAIIGIVLFLCLLLGFRYGLRLGMNASKGITPPPLKNPVIAVQDAVNDVKEHGEKIDSDRLFSEGLKNILSYTGEVDETR